MGKYFLISILVLLIFEASSDFTLTSDPSPLEGATVCPGHVHLFCNGTNIQTDVVRWFFGNSTEYANRAIERNEVLPDVVPVFTSSNPIPGVKILLIKSSTAQFQYTSYVSTLTVNISVFNMEGLSFKCGTFAQKSNTIALNFRISAPRDPRPNRLIPVYNNAYQLISVTATWRQLIPEPCQSTYRYHIIINRNRVFEDEKFAIAADVCIDLVCSTEFQIRSVSQQSEDFSVSIKSGDISNRHNGRLLSFSDTFKSSISSSLRFSVVESGCTATLQCSYFTTIRCTLQYTTDSSYEDLIGSPLSVPFDGLTLHRQSDIYYFQITVSVRATLRILYQGTFTRMTTGPAPQSPMIELMPIYENGQLNQLRVQWRQQVESPPNNPSDMCQLLTYSVVLENSRRARVDMRMINSDNCSNSLCSISFPISSPDQYFVTVNIGSVYGSTSSMTSLRVSQSTSTTISANATSDGLITPAYVPSDISFLIMMIGGLLLTVTY